MDRSNTPTETPPTELFRPTTHTHGRSRAREPFTASAILARKGTTDAADTLFAAVNASLPTDGLQTRLDHLHRIATLARELVRKAHREQMEVQRAIIREEDAEALRQRIAANQTRRNPTPGTHANP